MGGREGEGEEKGGGGGEGGGGGGRGGEEGGGGGAEARLVNLHSDCEPGEFDHRVGSVNSGVKVDHSYKCKENGKLNAFMYYHNNWVWYVSVICCRSLIIYCSESFVSKTVSPNFRLLYAVIHDHWLLANMHLEIYQGLKV